MKFMSYLALIMIIPLSSFATECLEYEPKVVTLVGEIKKVIFPGPPNYESIKEGDEPEPYWVLYLKNPICVKKNPNDEFTADEYNIRKLQIVIISSISNCTTLGKIPIGGNQSGKEVQTNESGRERIHKHTVSQRGKPQKHWERAGA